MNDIEKRLVKCFMLALPNLRESDAVHATAAGTADWDSLATVGLLSLIEEEFAITIPAEDVGEFVSFDRVVRVVRRQCGLEAE